LLAAWRARHAGAERLAIAARVSGRGFDSTLAGEERGGAKREAE
jgi:hypothetical protein